MEVEEGRKLKNMRHGAGRGRRLIQRVLGGPKWQVGGMSRKTNIEAGKLLDEARLVSRVADGVAWRGWRCYISGCWAVSSGQKQARGPVRLH